MWFGIRRCAYLWIVWALFAAGARAQATPIDLELDRTAPDWLPRCLSEASLSARYQVAREAGASTAPLAVQVRVVSQSAGQDATLEIRAANAVRSLGARALPVSARDCAAIPDAVALVLVLLSRSAQAEAPPEEPSPPPPAAAAPVAPPPASEPAAPEPPSAPGTQLQFGLGALFMFGQLPRPAFGATVEAELLFAVPSLRLRGAVLWPQTELAAEGSVRFSSYELALDGCLRTEVTSRPRLELRMCAGPHLGLMHAESSGFQLQNYRPVDVTLHLGAGPEAALELAKYAWLRAGAGAAIALFRPRYVLDVPDAAERQYVWEPGLVRAELSLCLMLIF
ncbi:MAG TPA: hypothetical protein VJR89_13750 [Polyangiales bacterium]|nr:hypothetical protein [Polyangiales bacterium]